LNSCRPFRQRQDVFIMNTSLSLPLRMNVRSCFREAALRPRVLTRGRPGHSHQYRNISARYLAGLFTFSARLRHPAQTFLVAFKFQRSTTSFISRTLGTCSCLYFVRTLASLSQASVPLAYSCMNWLRSSPLHVLSYPSFNCIRSMIPVIMCAQPMLLFKRFRPVTSPVLVSCQ